jgi:AcrR family transcriptional regulator
MARAPQPRKGPSPERQHLAEEIHELKRDKILAVAAGLFEKHGYLGTSLDAIAEQLGATKPYIYYRFETKFDMLAEICQRGTRDALAAANKAISGAGSASQRLRSFVEDFTAGALRNQQYIAIYFREEIHLSAAVAARIHRMRKEIDRDIRELLMEGNESGEFQVADPHVCSLAITGMASYAFAWYREQGQLTKEEIARSLADLVMRMVSADSRQQ